jgi:hypothetical protein
MSMVLRSDEDLFFLTQAQLAFFFLKVFSDKIDNNLIIESSSLPNCH